MDQSLLQVELQGLIAESKRRHPDVKEAAEACLATLQGRRSGAGAVDITKDGPHSDVLMRPILLGCATKIPKLINASIGALQRLVALQAVPPRSVHQVLDTLSAVITQGVDIQLRVLQAVLSLLTNCADIHGDDLGKALVLCLKLHDVKTAVVSSTAAATLRQAVMLVFERVSVEDAAMAASTSKDGSAELGPTPCLDDAGQLFADLCGLTSNAGRGRADKSKAYEASLLKVDQIPRTFGFELIEGVLGGFGEIIRSHTRLLDTARLGLYPIITSTLCSTPVFPVTLRAVRLVFVLLRSFAGAMPAEANGLFLLLVHAAAGEHMKDRGERDDAKAGSPAPLWLRILALEVLRGLCRDGLLLQAIFEYDEEAKAGHNAFVAMIVMLGKTIIDKPDVMGIRPDMQGLGVAPEGQGGSSGLPGSGGYLDIGLSVMSSAASAGVNSVSAMMSGDTRELSAASAPKTQCIEQHDKVDPPILADDYACLLAVQALNAIAQALRYLATYDDGLHTAGTPISSNRSAALVLASWPGLLAAYARLVASNLADDLFAECLDSMAAFTLGCSILGQETPRDAFLTTLARSAVPPSLVAAVQRYSEPPSTPKASSVVDSFAMTVLASAPGSTSPPTLSYRNLRCLSALVLLATAQEMTLGSYWYNILETMQNATHVLVVRRQAAGRKGVAPSQPGNVPRQLEDEGRAVSDLSDLAEEQIGQVFAMTPGMEKQEFAVFVHALIQLSSDMMGLPGTATNGNSSAQARSVDRRGSRASVSISSLGDVLDSPPPSLRRTSGLRVTNLSQEEQSFGLDQLRAVAVMNVNRLTTSLDVFDDISAHLLLACFAEGVSFGIKKQSAEILGDLVSTMFQELHDDIANKAEVQEHALERLAGLICGHTGQLDSPADADIRSRGLTALAAVLESSGDSIINGWGTILKVLAAVCPDPNSERSKEATFQTPVAESAVSPGEDHSAHSRLSAGLLRMAFPSLTLISSDYWSLLKPEDLSECISTLGAYASQDIEVNISLSAIGCMWNISDSVRQVTTMDSAEPSKWTGIMVRLTNLATDRRHEVRMSALQTFFRCLDAHGRDLEAQLWIQIFESCVLQTLAKLCLSKEGAAPALSDGQTSRGTQATPWGETRALALASTSILIHRFYQTKIRRLPEGDRYCQAILQYCVQAFSGDEAAVVDAALECSANLAGQETTPVVNEALQDAFFAMGEALRTGKGTTYTQRNLSSWLVLCQAIVPHLDGQSGVPDPSLNRLLDFVSSALRYEHSPDFAPDTDKMSDLQSKAWDLLLCPSISRSANATLALGFLAEALQWPFVAAFDYSDPFFSKPEAAPTVKGRISFVGLWKQAAPYAAQLAGRLYRDDATASHSQVVALIDTLALPISLRARCPPANRFGSDPPLWISAMEHAVPMIQQVLTTMPEGTAAGQQDICNRVVRCVIGALASTTASELVGLVASTSSVSNSISEDAALLRLIRTQILPRVHQLPFRNEDINLLGEALLQAGRLWRYCHPAKPYPIASKASNGTIARCVAADGEDFRYWCLDILFDSAVDEGHIDGHTCAATSFVPIAVAHAQVILEAFNADSPLRAGRVLERVRREEAAYLLQRVKDMRLVQTSIDPNRGNVTATATEPGESLRNALATSPLAHLLRLQPVLIDIATSDGPSYTTVAMPLRDLDGARAEGRTASRDIRQLAVECLKLLSYSTGAEMRKL